MDYGDSVQKVLLRKIQKAEQDLLQLKLDYCRFIFGLSHRTRVISNGNVSSKHPTLPTTPYDVSQETYRPVNKKNERHPFLPVARAQDENQ